MSSPKKGQPINPWKPEELSVLIEHLSKTGDNKITVENAAKDLPDRTPGAIIAKIYTMGMAGELLNVCPTIRFAKLRERQRQKEIKRLKEEVLKRDENREIPQETDAQPKPEEVKPKKEKKKKKLRLTGSQLDSHLIVAGATVINGEPYIGKMRITGKFIVEVL